VGKAPRPIALNRHVFQNVTTHSVRGFSPLAGNLIGQFQCHLHNTANITRWRRQWQGNSIPNPAEAWSDGAQQLTLEGFARLMESLKPFLAAAGRE
jgi:hypothetical protein